MRFARQALLGSDSTELFCVHSYFVLTAFKQQTLLHGTRAVVMLALQPHECSVVVPSVHNHSVV